MRKRLPDAENRTARQLFERCASGDPVAWRDFLDRYRPLIFRAARYKLRRCGVLDPGAEEDCVADVLTSLLRDGGARLLAYDPRYGPATWLGLRAATAVLDWVRHHRHAPPPDAARAASARADGGDPSLQADRRESAGALRTAVEGLRPREKIALRLVYEYGLSHRAAANLLGLSEGALAQVLTRCRARLRERLDHSEMGCQNPPSSPG